MKGSTREFVLAALTHKLIGQQAKRQTLINPTDTIYGAKRFIGRAFEDNTSVVNKEGAVGDGKGFANRVVGDENGEVGEKLGVRFKVDVERRIDGAAAVGAHRTSMLQDLERGRAMEIDALVTAVQEMGRLVGVPTPTIDVVLALVRQRGHLAGAYEYPAEAQPPKFGTQSVQ